MRDLPTNFGTMKESASPHDTRNSNLSGKSVLSTLQRVREGSWVVKARGKR